MTKQYWISSLRGIAILLVFFSHLYSVSGAIFKFVIGRIGVVIFFLLSGYLALSSRKKRTANQYIFNRLIRIYPIYWFILGLTYLAHLFMPYLVNKEWGGVSITDTLINATLFNQFVGVDCIIGASWMLPIQVSFFILIGITGVDVYTRNTEKLNMKYCVLAVLMILSVILGLIRRITGMPFPTAFMLLFAVSFLGIDFNYVDKNNIGTRENIILLIIFEVGLLISTILSYDNFIAYIVAYNLGIAFFVFFFYYNYHFDLLSKFSEVGFTFFLGAGLPFYIISMFIDFKDNLFIQICGWIVKFVLAYVFALLVTKYVERPLLKWEKQLTGN